jgi:uncharacterized protein YutE (UPF0331/DUF86 family)
VDQTTSSTTQNSQRAASTSTAIPNRNAASLEGFELTSEESIARRRRRIYQIAIGSAIAIALMAAAGFAYFKFRR